MLLMFVYVEILNFLFFLFSKLDVFILYLLFGNGLLFWFFLFYLMWLLLEDLVLMLKVCINWLVLFLIWMNKLLIDCGSFIIVVILLLGFFIFVVFGISMLCFISDDVCSVWLEVIDELRFLNWVFILLMLLMVVNEVICVIIWLLFMGLNGFCCVNCLVSKERKFFCFRDFCFVVLFGFFCFWRVLSWLI